MVTIFIGISGLGRKSGSPVYAGGNGFMLLLGAQLTSALFLRHAGLPFGIADTSARIKLALLGFGGRGDVFYPRNDYFPATASPLRALLVGTCVVGVGAMAVMLSFITLTAG